LNEISTLVPGVTSVMRTAIGTPGIAAGGAAFIRAIRGGLASRGTAVAALKNTLTQKPRCIAASSDRNARIEALGSKRSDRSARIECSRCGLAGPRRIDRPLDGL